jgi:GNAT superfamily N-acetyltransferase
VSGAGLIPKRVAAESMRSMRSMKDPDTMQSPLRISTDKQELDVALIHRFLSSEAYWSRDIPRDTVLRAIDGSLCFGGYVDSVGQVAFARVITDGATFAYLADVFVLEDQRGKGYSKQLMQAVMAHPRLQGLRRFMLATWDAHGLYAQFGFQPAARPDRLMEKLDMDVYTRNAAAPMP